MELIQYQVDAFTDRLFAGNPAAVCPLDEWLSAELMQDIAAENNLSETVFFVEKRGRHRIRWFTPTDEIKLCGHATLACAYVMFEKLGYDKSEIVFDSLSGELRVSKRDVNDQSMIELDFPVQATVEAAVPEGLADALGAEVLAHFHNEDSVVEVKDEAVLKSLTPNFSALMKVDARGIIVTSPSTEYDFVCRFFGPRVGVDEDPVTGSAFTKLVPYWAAKTGKKRFRAKQVSARGGVVLCELVNDRVKLAGQAVLFGEGKIYLP